jgi:low temperature requirement protein LtrA
MANWFDPDSPAVRAVLAGVMLASLLMAAALPEALGDDGLLFAVSYVALQVGRNTAALALLERDHRLRDVFGRLVTWSVVTGALWLAGAALEPDQRLLLWVPALALDLAAPVAGYWLPGRGRAVTTDYDIEGNHFAERCRLFILIALGESIVVTGATASQVGLTASVVACLVVAFAETVVLWWLYFGSPAERAHAAVSASDDPGRVARDAYTYAHFPIIAGIIATAAGDDLLIAHPHDPQHGVGLAIVLGGPALFLLGQNLFQWMATGAVNARRLLAAALLIGLVPLASHISALVLAAMVTVILIALAIWELRAQSPFEETSAPDGVAIPALRTD